MVQRHAQQSWVQTCMDVVGSAEMPSHPFSHASAYTSHASWRRPDTRGVQS